MAKPQPRSEHETIAGDAEMLRVIYPDLYEYLVGRDEMLHRILLRCPDPEDPESGAARIDCAALVTELKSLPPGLDDLVYTRASDSECDSSSIS